ncbi:MAG: amidohydrolase family protein [Bryobacteraceae bacterium]|nr:amidohydrolase family protein [Bryobacteraceae bacterium]MDW8378627.1 amidohydrolase family protein [Bryobacterales bacterium]
MHRLLGLLILSPLASLTLSASDAPGWIAIRHARIVTVSGPVIPKGTVLLHQGLIEAVGENVAEPPGAWIVEGEGLTVYPGLVDSLSSWGMPSSSPATGRSSGSASSPGSGSPQPPPARGPEDRPSNASYLLAADLIQPGDRRLESARGAGFTSAVVFPSREIFAGQGALINLAGEKPGAMVVHSPVGQLITIRSGFSSAGFPASLMGVIAYIRQLYLDAAHYREAKEFYAKHPLGNRRPEYDRVLEGLLASPRALLPANTRREIDRMARLARELDLRAVLYGVQEGYRSADLLQAANLPVLVNLKWPERERDLDPEREEPYRVLEFRDQAPASPAVLAKAGVKFAFYSGGIERPSDILRAVKKAIDAGLDKDAALRALTLSAAEIYGVADRLGSVDKGKIANLVVTKGDLFQEGVEVKYVFIDGRKFEPARELSSPAQEPTQQETIE